jgi:predicted acetyltransferase
MEIRQIDAQERAEVSLPIQSYAFQSSPADAVLEERLRKNQDYYAGNVTLVAEEDGAAVADASAIPMRQNIRGEVYPMAGVAGVATLPQARRRGYARALLTQLLGQMRDSGHVASALYPFRPSFYERFGYVGLPRTRTVTFSPSCFASLLHADLPGDVTWESAKEGYAVYRDFTTRLLADEHGFSVFPDYRAVEVRDADRWIAVARADGGEAAGVVTYRVTGHAQALAADDMLVASPLGRALLLQFFARHIDQVSEVSVEVAPGELPELWATDMIAVSQSTTAFPHSAAPMARVLSLRALAGMPTGQERVTVEVVDDRFTEGRYALDGRSGRLEVATNTMLESEATLTAAGLSALIYGVLDPAEIVIRGLGDISPEPAARLRQLFPRRIPYLYARF